MREVKRYGLICPHCGEEAKLEEANTDVLEISVVSRIELNDDSDNVFGLVDDYYIEEMDSGARSLGFRCSKCNAIVGENIAEIIKAGNIKFY